MSSFRIFCLVCFVSLCACRFKAPNLAEQKYLMEKGAFPGGVPDWVATPTGSNSGLSFSGGLIPQTFTQTPRANSGVPTAAESASSAGTFQTPDALKEKTPVAEPAAPNTPLHRIAKVCSTLEKEVNTALVTTDIRQRIRAYESLTARCPDSWDLWLWLGKDYAKTQQLVKAGRCFEKVLILNPTNEEAQDLANENRRKLNAPQAKPKKKKAALGE